jgi:hypothetical protein
MNIKSLFNKENLGFLIALILLLLLITKSCQNQLEIKKLKVDNLKLSGLNQKFKSSQTKTGEVVVQNPNVTTQEEAMKANFVEISEEVRKLGKLKELISQIKNTTTVYYPPTTIVYSDTFKLRDSLGNRYIKIPQTFRKTGEWLNFKAMLDSSGLKIDSLSSKNSFTLTLARVRKGIFGKTHYKSVLENKNPYAKTDSISSLIIKNDLKWYQKPKTLVGGGLLIGLVTGFIIAK